MSSLSNIKVQCTFRLEKLSKLITERIKGQRITDNLILEGILLRADDLWLHALIRVSGRHTGTIASRFRLETHEDISDFAVENLNIKIIEGGGLLAKGANFMFRHFLGDKIEMKVQQKIHDVLKQQISEITSRYSTVDLGEGLRLRSTIENYNFERIEWDEKELRIELMTSGLIHLDLK